MPNFFSDLLAATPSGSFDPNYRAEAGLDGQKLRLKQARFDLAAAALNDTVVLATLPSGARVTGIRVTTNTTSATGALHIGLYKAPAVGRDHVPAAANLIDNNLFADALGVTTAAARVDAFAEAALNDIHRGLRLWELANVGGASYSADPMEDWDIVATFSTALADTQEFLVEIEYVEVG